MKKVDRYLHVTWNEVEQSCISIYAKMCHDQYKPDVILGVLKGGVIPASLFVDFFGIPMKFVTLGAKSYTGIGEQRPIEFFPANPDKYIENANFKDGSRILLVDDIWDTGQTMNAILKLLNGKFDIKIATIFARLDSKVLHINQIKSSPDYCDRDADKEWIVFPWERYEFWREINK